MKKYVLKRMLGSLVILFFLSALVYFLIRVMPGDYVRNTIVGNPAITADMKQSLLLAYGLKDSIGLGYLKWMRSVLCGDLGQSFMYQIPVIYVIGKTIGVTLFISLTAFVLEIVLSVFLGMTAAVHKFKRTDTVISVLSVISVSLPGFFFAVILQRLFAIELPLFPVSGLISVRSDFSGLSLLSNMLWHLCLPVAVLVVTRIGSYIKYIRTSTLQVLNADFVLAARAKGLSNRQVMLRHVLPNTLVSFLSILSADIPALFTSTLIVEQIFSINGLGYTAFAALKMADTPLIMGFTMVLGVITIVSVFISDMIYGLIDPRIKLGRSD